MKLYKKKSKNVLISSYSNVKDDIAIIGMAYRFQEQITTTNFGKICLKAKIALQKFLKIGGIGEIIMVTL